MCPLQLFISYSHNDEIHKEDFVKHLSPLVKEHKIKVWHDREMMPGDILDEKIKEELARSEIVAFLISANFLSSISCYELELLEVLKRNDTQKVIVLPVIIDHCNWLQTPLKKYVATPPDAIPITDYTNREEAWTIVVDEIAKLCNFRKQNNYDDPAKICSQQNDDRAIISTFQQWLKDTQLPIEHSYKEHIELEDLFVYQDVRKHEYTETPTELIESSSQFNALENLGQGVLLIGDEQTGKTSLAKTLFLNYFTIDLLPLYIDANDIKSTDIGKTLTKCTKEQYQNLGWTQYLESNRQRIAIIDNYHELRLNTRYEKRLLEKLQSNFDHIILISDRTILDNQERIIETITFTRWEILPFGHVRRGELIEKWVCLGQEETISNRERHERIDTLTRHVNSIVGNNIVPPRPLYVLTIVQFHDSILRTNFELTSYGDCYQTLIWQALHKAGIHTRQFDLYVNYLSEFAYTCLEGQSDGLDGEEYANFQQSYSNKYYHHSHDEIFDTLLESEILIKRDGILKFHYKYIYYFCAAKYLANNLSLCLEQINDMCEKLHLEVYANILIFLLYHTKDERIIDRLKSKADRIFSSKQIATLNVSETRYIADALDELPKLVMAKIDIEETRKKSLVVRDREEMENCEDDDEDDQRTDEQLEDVGLVEVKHSVRMVDVIGQVLRNRSGSLAKLQLRDLAKSGIGSALRFLSDWLDFTRDHEDDMVNLIAALLYDVADQKPSERKLAREAKKMYLVICYEVCRGVLLRIVNAMGSRDLLELFQELADRESHSIAYRLIGVAVKIEFEKSIPSRDIDSLLKELESNPIGKRLLTQLVLRHVYFNEVTVQEKQWISSKLGVGMQTQRQIGSKEVVKR